MGEYWTCAAIHLSHTYLSPATPVFIFICFMCTFRRVPYLRCHANVSSLTFFSPSSVLYTSGWILYLHSYYLFTCLQPHLLSSSSLMHFCFYPHLSPFTPVFTHICLQHTCLHPHLSHTLLVLHSSVFGTPVSTHTCFHPSVSRIPLSTVICIMCTCPSLRLCPPAPLLHICFHAHLFPPIYTLSPLNFKIAPLKLRNKMCNLTLSKTTRRPPALEG